MAKKKYYAVKKGKIEGIFDSWPECQKQIKGVSGAIYKGFATLEEAESYLSEDGNSTVEKQDTVCKGNEDERMDPIFHLTAYVDGSYDHEIGRYSFGCVIITPLGEEIRESGSNNDPASIQLRNVAGEMLGAMYAIKWAINNGYKSIDLYYDYEGIEKWATHDWKARNPLTAKYAEFMDESAKKLSIRFFKVVAHTGVKYNEEVDRLAKKALSQNKGIPKIKKGDFWYTVDGISRSDLETVIKLVVEELGEDKASYTAKENANGMSYTLMYIPKERVVVNHYTKNDKVVIQGKPEKTFSTLLSYITELVEFEEIPAIFNSVYQLNVPKDNVASQFQGLLPNAHDKLPAKLAKTLHQAVYNLNITGDIYDATFLAQPVIRAIDGHLRYIMITNIPSVTQEDIKIHGYHYFRKVGDEKYVLEEGYVPTGMKDEMKRYIGRCYSFFHRNRNILSHWDDPTAPLDTTKLLDVHNAHDLINRTLNLIDEYYEMR